MASILEKEDSTGLWLIFQNSDSLYEYDRAGGICRALPWPEALPANPVRLQNGRVLFVGAGGFYELKNDRLIALPLLSDLVAKNVHLGKPEQDTKGFL